MFYVLPGSKAACLTDNSQYDLLSITALQCTLETFQHFNIATQTASTVDHVLLSQSRVRESQPRPAGDRRDQPERQILGDTWTQLW